MSLVAIVGAAACVAFVIELAPQPLRIWRTRSLEGISVTGSGVTLATELGWLVYGIGGGYRVVVVTAVVASSLKLWQFTLTRPRWTRRNLRLVVAWSATVTIGALSSTLGFVLVGGLLFGLGPQAVAVRRSSSITGVSPGRWWLALCSGLLWVAYGLLSGATAVAITGAAGAVLAILALQRILTAAHPLHPALHHRSGNGVSRTARRGNPGLN